MLVVRAALAGKSLPASAACAACAGLLAAPRHASSQLAPPRATRSAPVAWALRARRLRRAALRLALYAHGARRSAHAALRAEGATRRGRYAPRALRAEGATRRGRCAPVCQAAQPLAAITASRYTRSAPRWRGRCAPGRLYGSPVAASRCALGTKGVGAARPSAHMCSPGCARCLLGMLGLCWGCRRRRALYADRDAWCKARFARSCRGRGWGWGVSDIIMHESVRGNACVLPQHVQCESAHLCNRSALPPGQADPPRTLSARARLHAAARWRGAS